MLDVGWRTASCASFVHIILPDRGTDNRMDLRGEVLRGGHPIPQGNGHRDDPLVCRQSIGNTKPLFTPSSGASQHPAGANPVPRGATPQPRRSTNWAALQAASMDGSAVRALGATARGGDSWRA